MVMHASAKLLEVKERTLNEADPVVHPGSNVKGLTFSPNARKAVDIAVGRKFVGLDGK